MRETADEKTWETILSNAQHFIREAGGKFIPAEIIHRFYSSLSRRDRKGLLKDDLC